MIKTLSRWILSGSVLAYVAMPVVASAAIRDFNLGDLLPNFQEPFGGGGTLLGVVGTIITLAFGVAGLVAVIYLIIGGFQYVTAGGNPETVEAAKTTIVNAVIGLVVILISYLVVQFVMSQLGARVDLPN